MIVRPTIVFTPTEDFKFTLLTQFQNYDDGGGVARAVFPDNGVIQNQQRLWGFLPNPGKYETNVGNIGYTKISASHVIGEFEWQVLGGTWTTIVANRDLEYKATLNVSGDPFDTLVFPNNVEKATQSSIETRFNGSVGEKIDYLARWLLARCRANVRERRESSPIPVTAITYFDSPWVQDSESKAVFANLDYRFNDQWIASAGVRYTEDDKEICLRPLASCGTTPTGCDDLAYIPDYAAGPIPRRASCCVHAHRGAINFYLSFSKGYRPATTTRASGTAQITADAGESRDERVDRTRL